MKKTPNKEVTLPQLDASISRRKFIGTTAGTVAAGMLANKLPAMQATGAKSDKMNLLFIMTDQQFAEAMSCAGNTWVETPNMDRIAARGTRFNQAYAAQPLCAPCRTSIQTGHWPTQNRCTNNSMKGKGAQALSHDGCLSA